MKRKPATRVGVAALLALVASAGTAGSPDAESLRQTHELTAADADAWLDGYLPYVLAQADIAGAVVVIVKDGQVLTQRGYGYADVAARQRVDPATTLFRPGSISKLFTWTAVMQLVEQRKIDLDVDVNRYLDFTIPPFAGKPITMRNMMTHTPGFEAALKHLIVFEGQSPVPALGDALKQRLPKRVFAPGTTGAYSNYAVGLAGYIVERVSGMPFEDYIDRKVFAPLGMTHATFRQPLPAALAPFMSKGYARASADPEPYEFVTLPPAGSLAVSAADMAKFMIAHLDQGAGLMQPATAQLMHDPAHIAVAGVDRMALGFHEQRINGLGAIGHAGDAINFHSDLWLFPAQQVGMFISMNSAGTGRATHEIRLALFQQFGERYFPEASAAPLVELSTAKEHAKMLTGSYIASGGSFSNFVDVGNFIGQTKIGLDNDGRPFIPSLPSLAGAPRLWIEVAPFQWRDAQGPERLAALVENGRVVRWGIDDDAPTDVYNRAPWYRDAAWLKPLCLIALIVVALTALSWPAAALARRRYGAANPLSGADLLSYRLLRGFSWLTLIALAGWLSLLELRTIVMDNIDGRVWLLEIAGTLGGFGLLAAALWNLWRVGSRPRGPVAAIWSGVQALAAAAVLDVMLTFHLISFGTNF
jgi:CubicO group peptidase (beta-lactamase class C family)